MTRRRTQEERRQETIGKLLAATIACLSELGYAGTSTSKIVSRAGVSQGALFNHFDSRVALIVAATEEVCARHLAQFARVVDVAARLPGDRVEPVVAFARETARAPAHAAWHEVMVAARTDAALREGVRGALARFEAGLLDAAQAVFEVPDARMERFGAVVLSLMHAFDSEAVTVGIVSNEAIEAQRTAWAAEVLRAELAALAG